jgi:hypothetical protein
MAAMESRSVGVMVGSTAFVARRMLSLGSYGVLFYSLFITPGNTQGVGHADGSQEDQVAHQAPQGRHPCLEDALDDHLVEQQAGREDAPEDGREGGGREGSGGGEVRGG